MTDTSKNKFKIGQKVSYHPFIGKAAVSSDHEIIAIKTMPNSFGENVAWITGKSGCISFNCLSHDIPVDYVLRDSRTNCGGNFMFWAVGGSYTTDLLQAERFTKDEALSQHHCRGSDEPMLFDKLLEVANSRIDMQYLDIAKANKCARVTMVVQVLGEYDGNDIMFATDYEGGTTYNFQDALVVNGDEPLSDLAELPFHYKLWPMPYMKELVRKSIQADALAKAFS